MKKTNTVKTVTPSPRWLLAFADGETREVKAATLEAACKRWLKLGPAIDIAKCKRLRNVELTPEISEKRRAAVLSRYEGKDRTPYKTIRLSARAVEMIRSAAKRDKCSASAVVTSSLACAEYYADLWKEHGNNNR